MLLPSAVKTTMTVLRPETYHLSPCIGLALSAGGSSFLSRLYELEPKTKVATGARGQAFDGVHTVWKGSPVGALARDLFHRNHPEEPMRPTTNRSLAAAHISSSLCAQIVGLAWSRPGSAAVHSALRASTCSDTGLQLPALARETGVTIARFERLVEQICDADDVAGDDPMASLPHAGMALLLRHHWLRSTSSGDLWTYLRELGTHFGALRPDAVIPAPSSSSHPAFVNAELHAENVLQAANILFAPEASRAPEAPSAAAATTAAAASDEPEALAAAAAFEVLAAALALGGRRPAPLSLGRYGFMEQGAVADCAEMVARELLNALLWDPAAQRFDDTRIPPRALPGLKAFYAPSGPAHLDSAAHGGGGGGGGSSRNPRRSSGGGSGDGGGSSSSGESDAPVANWHAPPPVYTKSSELWFQLVSGLRGVPYLSGIPPNKRYELAPTCDAVAKCLGVLLGAPEVRSPADLEAFWREHVQPGRAMRLVVNASGDRMFLLEPGEEQHPGDMESTPSSEKQLSGSVPGAQRPSYRAKIPTGAGEEADGAMECQIEFVMAERLNHAFSIHHTRPPRWQGPAAALALSHWPWRDEERLRGVTVPRLTLMPALLQPVLTSASVPEGWGRSSQKQARRIHRLMLLSADAYDDTAVGRSLLRFVRLGDGDVAGAGITDADLEVAARVLATTPSGLGRAGDALIVDVARAAVRSGSASLRHAAMLHPPLSAVAAMLGGDAQAWARAVRASPLECLRLTLVGWRS